MYDDQFSALVFRLKGLLRRLLGLCHAEKERVTEPLERFAFCVVSGV